MFTYPWKKRSKSTWLTVYSGSKLSLFSPILADGSSYTTISVVRFEVGCPFPRCLWPGLGGLKETKMFLPHPRVKVSIMGSLRDREVAFSASDRQGSNFESCVWRTVSSQSSHHPQEVLLAQFSLYVHKGGLKPDSFHFISFSKFVSWRSEDENGTSRSQGSPQFWIA